MAPNQASAYAKTYHDLIKDVLNRLRISELDLMFLGLKFSTDFQLYVHHHCLLLNTTRTDDSKD